MALLLDTCTLLWLVADKNRLSENARVALSSAAEPPFVSGISAFEIAARYRSHGLRLPLPPDDWYREAIEFHGLVELPVTGSIAARAALLPPQEGDLCDRTIVATALENALVVLTPDPSIARFDGVQVLW